MGPLGEEKIARTLYLLPVSRPRCSMTVGTTQHCPFTSVFLLTLSFRLRRLGHIPKTPICHVSSTRLRSLRSSTAVDPPCPFPSKLIVSMNSGCLSNVPSFVRVLTDLQLLTPSSPTSLVPPDTTLKGGSELLCGQEATPGHEVILCPRYKHSHRHTTSICQRGIARGQEGHYELTLLASLTKPTDILP